jgi:hypothetical protein
MLPILALVADTIVVAVALRQRLLLPVLSALVSPSPHPRTAGTITMTTGLPIMAAARSITGVVSLIIIVASPTMAADTTDIPATTTAAAGLSIP